MPLILSPLAHRSLPNATEALGDYLLSWIAIVAAGEDQVERNRPPTQSATAQNLAISQLIGEIR
ncbi:MAG: hypothetical protein WBO29_07930 [Albidovulum sp.]